MISICIPIFNYDVQPLVTELLKVMSRASIPAHIILIDDGSEKEFVEMNNQFSPDKIRYISLKENTGRAAVRNLFLQYTQDDWLLFLDGDTVFNSEKNSHFFQNYSNAIHENPTAKIIVGGSYYAAQKPPLNRRLRWKYGTCKETRGSVIRSQQNAALMGNNFLIERALLEKYPFDKKIKKYGHEDTLLGITLQNAGYSIFHIDNPVENGNLETNKEFLQKTENAIDNLLAIEKNIKNKDALKTQVRLLSYRDHLKKNKMDQWVLKAFNLAGAPSKKLLISGFINLRLLNFYKIGYLLKKEKSLQ
ncbi:MAG: glycosyltransferase family 2 protein [Ginsengibacter sp.]